MSLDFSQRGTSPTGETVDIPVSGSAYKYIQNLTPGQSINTGWIPTEGYPSLHYIIQSSAAGLIAALEYSSDGVTVSSGGTSRAYDGANVGLLLQTFLALKDNYFRLTYTNGSTATTTFYLECRLSATLGQNTMNSIFLPVTKTNVASIVKNIQEADNGSGVFGQIQRTGSSLNVNVTNQPTQTPTDVSNLAKDNTLTNGSQTVQVVDGNNQTRGIDALPFKVQFPANYTPPVTPISDNGGSITVDGTVNANVNFPASQTVNGSVLVTNFPTSTEIANDTGNPVPVNGTVNIGNLPTTQPISGSVSVNNFPSTQPISGNVNATITGTPSVNANVTFPTTQQVSGSVSVSNLPANQNVSVTNTPTVNIGTIPSVEVSNDVGNPIPVSGTFFQSTQPVSALTLPLPTGASTAANQGISNASLASIDGKLGNTSTSALQTTLNTAIGNQNDPIVTDATQNASLISLTKGILQESIAPATVGAFQDIALTANVAQTIPANANRKGLIISSSNGTILIGIGYTATATRWSYRVVTNGSMDIPEHWAPLSVSLISTAVSTATATLIT